MLNLPLPNPPKQSHLAGLQVGKFEGEKRRLEDWVSAYNARDPHAPSEFDRDDAENHQVAFGDPLNGREALLEIFVTFFQAFRDNYTRPENLFEDGEWA